MDFGLRAVNSVDKGDYRVEVVYSGKFKPYRASVSRQGNNIVFHLSRSWEGISDDIKLGLCEELSCRLFKKKVMSFNIELYNSFVKRLHHVVPKNKSEPVLASSFTKLNDCFFNGLLGVPNFVWGGSCRKLGSYDYHSDTIMISKILENDLELLEYVLYHEMLHKKLQFSHSSFRHCYHPKEFRDLEANFGDQKELEHRLQVLVKKFRSKLFIP